MPEQRSSHRGVLFAFLAVGPGCESRSQVFLELPEVPASVVRIAAYVATEDGAVESSTALLSMDEAPLRIELEAAVELVEERPVRVIGYSANDLTIVGGGPEGTLADAPLVTAEDCASVLPEPSFEAWLTDAEAPKRSLSAAWLDGRCPDHRRDQPHLVDASCARPHCGQTVVVRGCELTADLPRCNLPTLNGRFLADGRVCLLAQVGECSPPDPSCVSTAEGCELRFVPVDTLEVEVATLSTYPGVPPRIFDEDSRLAASHLESLVGYITDVLVVDEDLIILGHSGEWFIPFELAPTAVSELRFHGASDLELVETATVPGWAFRLERNPRADTLLLSTRMPDGFYVVELRRDGTELRRLLLHDRDPIQPEAGFPVGSFVLDERGWYVSVFDDEFNASPDEAVVVDLDTWQIAQRMTLSMMGQFGRPRVASGLTDAQMAYADLAANAMVFVDLETTALRTVPLLPSESAPLNTYPMGMMPGGPGFTVIQAFSGAGSAVRGYTEQSLFEEAEYFEARADVTALARVPDRPSRALVVVETGVEGDRTAALSLFNLNEFQFLPGRREVGFGPSNRVRTDDEGNLWIVFGWSGELVRARVTDTR